MSETQTLVIDYMGNSYISKEEIIVKSAGSDEQKYAVYNAQELIDMYAKNGFKVSKLFFRKRELILYWVCFYYFEITFIKREGIK